MRRIAGLSVSLVFCSAASLLAQNAPAAAGSVLSGSPAQIRASGTVTRAVPADLAIVTIEFSGRGYTGLEAATAMAARGNALRKALMGLGIPDDSLVSRGYPAAYYYAPDRMNVEVVYNPTTHHNDSTFVGHDYLVARIRDLKLLGRVPNAALGAGADRIMGMQFLATNTTAAAEEALSAATRQARRNAELIAAALGGTLGRLIDLGTTGEPLVGRIPGLESDLVPAPFSGVSLAATRELPQPVVRPGNVEVRASVFGRWEFLPGH